MSIYIYTNVNVLPVPCPNLCGWKPCTLFSTVISAKDGRSECLLRSRCAKPQLTSQAHIPCVIPWNIGWFRTGFRAQSWSLIYWEILPVIVLVIIIKFCDIDIYTFQKSNAGMWPSHRLNQPPSCQKKHPASASQSIHSRYRNLLQCWRLKLFGYW